jgi:hypothetical protein
VVGTKGEAWTGDFLFGSFKPFGLVMMGGCSMLFVSGVSGMGDTWLVVSCWRMGWGNFWGFSFLPACGFALGWTQPGFGAWGNDSHRTDTEKMAWLRESKCCFAVRNGSVPAINLIGRQSDGSRESIGSVDSLELTLPSWLGCLHGDVMMLCEASCGVLVHGMLTPRIRCPCSRGAPIRHVQPTPPKLPEKGPDPA